MDRKNVNFALSLDRDIEREERKLSYNMPCVNEDKYTKRSSEAPPINNL